MKKEEFYVVKKLQNGNVIGSCFKTLAFSYISDEATSYRHSVVDFYEDKEMDSQALKEKEEANNRENYIEEFMRKNNISYTNGSSQGLKEIDGKNKSYDFVFIEKNLQEGLK